MQFEDKKLVCRDCGVQFVWTAGEQEFFSKKGFTNIPSRCPECRKKNRNKKDKPTQNQKFETSDNPTIIKCKNCQKPATVNFAVKNPNDILCAGCFEKQLDQASN